MDGRVYRVLPGTDIRVYNEGIGRGRISHAVFDFDGTISLLRKGWETVMEEVMLGCICGGHEPGPEIVDRVRRYIRDSSGEQTIVQMEALANMVREYGLVPEDMMLDAGGYKRIYNECLMLPVSHRVSEMESGKETLDGFMVKGSLSFCRKLSERGTTMYLVSGTDSEDVINEAARLKASRFFMGGIYGAVGSVKEYSKDKTIRRILQEHRLAGEELAVFGDGPVEIRDAKRNGAIAVGVASDENKGYGWNEEKMERLARAGCDIMVPDFSEDDELLDYLFDEI